MTTPPVSPAHLTSDLKTNELYLSETWKFEIKNEFQEEASLPDPKVVQVPPLQNVVVVVVEGDRVQVRLKSPPRAPA